MVKEPYLPNNFTQENSEFKSALLRLKVDLVSHPAHDRGSRYPAVGWLLGSYDVSIVVDYLMPNPFLYK